MLCTSKFHVPPAETPSKNKGHELLPFLTALGFEALGLDGKHHGATWFTKKPSQASVYVLHGNPLPPVPRGARHPHFLCHTL